MIRRFLLVTMAVFISAAAVSAQKPAPAAPHSTEATRALVKSYLQVQTALAEDRFDDVKGPARSIASQAAALGAGGAELAKAATALVNAADLAAARNAFGPLSDAVIARVKAEGSSEVASQLKLAYCPMTRKSWLQSGEQVRNPYYGTKMLTCGELKPVK